MMTQLNSLSNNVMGDGLRSVNAVRTKSGWCPNSDRFEALYNEEVQNLGN